MDTPPEQIGEENMDVTLRCEVKGGEKTVLIWTSEGKELQHKQFYDLFDDEKNGSVIDSDHESIDSHDSNSVTEVTDNDDMTKKIVMMPSLRCGEKEICVSVKFDRFPVPIGFDVGGNLFRSLFLA
ncbi:hypothetical protein FQA39_LY17861 [Lamprigera yunnana]|nr:hypothetical protein FQA39_LY17861 [Lamprigera yunnana]